MAHISDILLFKQLHYIEYSYKLTNLNFKTMKKRLLINLHNLSQAELAKREESLLKGGNEPIARGSFLVSVLSDVHAFMTVNKKVRMIRIMADRQKKIVRKLIMLVINFLEKKPVTFNFINQGDV